MTTELPQAAEHLEQARAVVRQLDLREAGERLRPESGHNSSLLLPCVAANGKSYLLKFFVPPTEGKFYPYGVRVEDYARREGAFYRFLDSTDPDRTLLPAPKTILLDPVDPPRWILLEWIPGAVGPAEEVLGMDHVIELIQAIQRVPLDMLLGRRYFPLNHWDVVSCLDRVRLMYDPVLFVVGEDRWKRSQAFFKEALRWTDQRAKVMVHGDFTEQNILVDEDGRPHLIDFERIGIGNENHDFAWFWIHSERSQTWKRDLLERYLGHKVGSTRVQSEWGIRAALVYLAIRRLRFGYLMHGDTDEAAPRNLALLDAALSGGTDLFPA